MSSLKTCRCIIKIFQYGAFIPSACSEKLNFQMTAETSRSIRVLNAKLKGRQAEHGQWPASLVCWGKLFGSLTLSDVFLFVCGKNWKICLSELHTHMCPVEEYKFHFPPITLSIRAAAYCIRPNKINNMAQSAEKLYCPEDRRSQFLIMVDSGDCKYRFSAKARQFILRIRTVSLGHLFCSPVLKYKMCALQLDNLHERTKK